MMERKPEWLRVRYNQDAVNEVAELMRELNLNTVCREANCPNLGECYRKHTSTFLILGSVCTRNCRFCNVTTGKPQPLDPDEPMNVAIAAKKLKLRHVVLTCSTRDDLPDGGAEQFAKTVRAIRELCPGTTVETLISDMKMNTDALDTVIAAHPEAVEAVAREIGEEMTARYVDGEVDRPEHHPGCAGPGQCDGARADAGDQERPGQAFDVTGLPNGTYWIEVLANPDGKLTESDRTNNTALRKVVLGGTAAARTVTVPPYEGIDTDPSVPSEG